MAFACGKCGLIANEQPCLACGAPVFDLANATELEALRFTLSRRAQMRAGLGAGIGLAIGFVHGILLAGDGYDRHYELTVAWVFALAAVAILVRPRAIAELENEVAARTRPSGPTRRAMLVTLTIAASVIVGDTAFVLHREAATMPRKDARHLVVDVTCKLAHDCSTAVICLGEELGIDLRVDHSRIDRSDVDDCLTALHELERTHTTCTAPAPPACTAISSTTIPELLGEAHALEHELDRTIHDQLQRSLDRAR